MIEVVLLEKFKKELRRFSKKFRTLPHELEELIEMLEESPKLGKDLGGGLYKIRLGSQSKGGGKSGGFRVVTYYIEKKDEIETLYLVIIYDKSEEENISKKDLLKMLKNEDIY